MRILSAALLFAAALPSGGGQATRTGKVIIVPIVGEIGAKNTALVRRAAARVRAEKPDLVLFEIDTPGGGYDYMITMGEEIMRLAPVPTAAWIRPPLGEGLMMGGALSAGVYIAVSCKKLYMHPGTVIGASTPIMVTPVGPVPVGEKILSAAREKFRARAEQNGYPGDLIVAMVDEQLEIFEIVLDGKRRYVTEGEIEKLKDQGRRFEVPTVPFDSKVKLLTLTDRQVAETGMGKVADSRRAIYEEYGLDSPAEEVLDFTWSEEYVSFITSGAVRTVLLILGVLGIWLEFKTPGFGLPGILGIAAFAVLLFGHHLAGLAEVPEILLVFVGVALLAVEIFVLPGTGLFAIGGILCVFAGFILSFQFFTLPDVKGQPWQVDTLVNSVGQVIVAFAGAAIGFAAALRFLPKVPVLGRLVLQAEIAGTAPAPPQAPALVGRMGHAVTPLHPGGKIEVDGQVHDVVADGEFVAQGEPVEVLRVEGMRIVVGRAKR